MCKLYCFCFFESTVYPLCSSSKLIGWRNICALGTAFGVWIVASFLCLYLAPNFLSQSVLIFSTYQFWLSSVQPLPSSSLGFHSLLSLFLLYFVQNILMSFSSLALFLIMYNVHVDQLHLLQRSTLGHFHPWRFSSQLFCHPWRFCFGCKISWFTWRWNGQYLPFLTICDCSFPKSHSWIWATFQNLGGIIWRSHLLGFVPYIFFWVYIEYLFHFHQRLKFVFSVVFRSFDFMLQILQGLIGHILWDEGWLVVGHVLEKHVVFHSLWFGFCYLDVVAHIMYIVCPNVIPISWMFYPRIYLVRLDIQLHCTSQWC